MTNTESIREIQKTVSALEERLDNARTEIIRVDAFQSKSADSHVEIRLKIAVLEENVRGLKKAAEEKDRRHWAVLMELISSLLALAVSIGSTYMKLNK